MKFFNWMQSKFNAGQGRKSAHALPVTDYEKKEDYFSDWPPHGLLAIGTFGNKDLTDNKQDHLHDQIPETEIPQCSSPDPFSEFRAEEIVKLEKELTKLLTRKQEPIAHDHINLPLHRFLNSPSSLELDLSTTIADHHGLIRDDNTEDEEEEIARTIRIILGRCKDVSKKKKTKASAKKLVSLLVKKMFVCTSGFAPSPNFPDTFQESRMEKLMRTILLTKKIHPRNSSGASSTKKCLEDCRYTHNEEDEPQYRSIDGSKWDKTDSEFIVLEI